MRREMMLRGKKEGEREEGWLGRCREASGGGRPTTAENASISPTRGDKRRSTPSVETIEAGSRRPDRSLP
jgi:hypothetical protein